MFWVGATKVEALFGLGLKADSDLLKQLILSSPPPTSDLTVDAQYKRLYKLPMDWMVDTMNDQLAKLAALNP
jgi:hypothetical protein